MSTVLEDVEDRDELLPHQTAGNRHRYSLGRALSRLVDNPHRPLDGLEGEVSAELAIRGRRNLRGPCGLFVPWDAPLQTRALTTTTGTGSITTLPGPVVDVLRARSYVLLLGTRVIADARGGAFGLPRRTATAAVSWVAEGAAPATQTNQTLDVVTFTPHTVSAFCDVTRKATASIPQSEDLVIDDLTRALGTEVDKIVLQGTGAAGQPLGILPNPAVAAVAVGAPTWAKIAGLRQVVALANGDVGPLGWIVSPNGEFKLRTTERASPSGAYIWSELGGICGAPAYATNQCPSASGVLGSWSLASLVMWGPLEININPYLFSSLGFLRVSAFMDCDFQVLQPTAFTKFTDMTVV